MISIIAGIFIFAGAISFFAFIIGLIKPSWVRCTNRKKVFYYLAGYVVFIFIGGVIAPKPEPEPQATLVGTESTTTGEKQIEFPYRVEEADTVQQPKLSLEEEAKLLKQLVELAHPLFLEFINKRNTLYRKQQHSIYVSWYHDWAKRTRSVAASFAQYDAGIRRLYEGDVYSSALWSCRTGLDYLPVLAGQYSLAFHSEDAKEITEIDGRLSEIIEEKLWCLK